jgi:lysophospholipase L1-like esterase
MSASHRSQKNRIAGVRVVRVMLVCLSVAGLLASACGGATSPSPIVPDPPSNPAPPTPTPTPVPPPTLRVTRILAFGDSMTWGTTSQPVITALTAGLPVSYPFKLQTLVTARYTAQTITVSNVGKPGEEVLGSGTLKRFNDALSEAKPELVLLMEGANDLNNIQGSVNDAITVIVGNLEEMVKEAGRRGIPIMVGTLPPERPDKRSAAALLPRFNDAVKVMAAKKGAILVDVNVQFPESLIGQDGLHPTEEGYQRLAEIYLTAIKGLYESAGATAVTASRQ